MRRGGLVLVLDDFQFASGPDVDTLLAFLIDNQPAPLHLAVLAGGTTHRVMSPLEFMQRLAALVRRRGLHLTRFHGVLAPSARVCAMVVPQEPEPAVQAAPPTECKATARITVRCDCAGPTFSSGCSRTTWSTA